MEKSDWTPEMIKSLRTSYQAALKLGDAQFTWQGQAVLVSYAKYLLEWLES